MLRIEAVGGKARVAKNRGEQIIEVMGDAAGELTDRLELLRLAQLRLERAAFGDVHDDAEQVRRMTVGVVEHPGPGIEPADRAVGPTDTKGSRVVTSPPLGGQRHRRAGRRAIVWVHEIEEGVGGARRMPGFKAEHRCQGFGPSNAVGRHVDLPDAHASRSQRELRMVDVLFQGAIRELDIVGHGVERLAEQADLVIPFHRDALLVLARRQQSRDLRDFEQRSRDTSRENRDERDDNGNKDQRKRDHPHEEALRRRDDRLT